MASKDVIRQIEDLPLSPSEAVSLCLVYLGKKPATTIFLHSGVWRKGQKALKLNNEDVTRTISVLNNADLAYCYKTEVSSAGILQDSTSSRLIEYFRIDVAESQNLLDKLIKASKEKDNYTIGMCYGYPETAVSLFGRRDKLLSRDDMPIKYQINESVIFGQFMYSKDYYRQEMEVGKAWSEAIKKNSDILYWNYLHDVGPNVSAEALKILRNQ